MFTAYFDDGGSNARQRIGVLAGYVAPEEEWKRFGRQWGELLSDPSVLYFRAHDCEKGEGVYSGVSELERRAAYARAVDIICGHALVSVAVAGRRPDFEGKWAAQVRQEPPEFSRSALELSARSGFVTLGLLFEDRWRGWYRERVTLVCEEAPPQTEQTVCDAYRRMISSDQYKHFTSWFTGPPTFHPKEAYAGLQAADLLAYEMGKEYARRVDASRRHVRDEWRRLLEHSRQHKAVLRLMRRFSPNTFGFTGEDSGI